MTINARIAVAEQYRGAGDLPMAVKCIHEGLNVDPHDVELLQYLSMLHMQSRNYGVVYQLMKRAKEVSPGDPEVEHNLGLAILNMASIANREDFLDESEKHLRKAIAMSRGAMWQSYSGLAQICLARGEFDAVISHAQKAVEMFDAGEAQKDEEERRPIDTSVLQTAGFARLAKGDFGRGFDEVDAHLGGDMRKPKPVSNEPYWRGPAYSGNVVELNRPKETVFVQGEQGLGDEISFASCFNDAGKDAQLTIECDPRLEGLFRRSFPHLEIHGSRAHGGKAPVRDWARGRSFDSMCLSGTLVRHYRREASDFPKTGFLRPDPERRLQWKALLNSLPGKKVGIAWNGGVPINFKGRRSMKLRDLDWLLKTPGITWVSLEYKDASEEIEEYRQKTGINIQSWPRATEGDDYDETAALVSELDAVVSVCTAVVHLCGALGKRAHVLVPQVPRWFYGAAGRDHPWYSSLILHRKKREWPLDEVKRELTQELGLVKEAASVAG